MSEIILSTQLIPLQLLDFTPGDQAVLRDLAGQIASLAQLPVEAEKRELWRKHNSLAPTRPLIFCDPEIGWGEIILEEQLKCANPVTRRVERYMRMIIFWGAEMQDDRPIDPFFALPNLAEPAFWGLKEVRHGGENGGSYVWEAPVKTEEDIEKLHFPEMKIDLGFNQKLVERLNSIFGDLLPVKIKYHWWWTLGLTDTLARLRGLEQLMIDMVDSPKLIHRMMAMLRDGTLAMLDELETKGLLSPNWDTAYVGSGGIGLVDELPQPDFQGMVRTQDMWGFAEYPGDSRRLPAHVRRVYISIPATHLESISG